jgi:5'-3' exonuclease
MNKIGIIDWSYFMYRAFESYLSKELPGIKNENYEEDELVTGFFSDCPDKIANRGIIKLNEGIDSIQEQFDYTFDAFIFCMDSNNSEARLALLPDYRKRPEQKPHIKKLKYKAFDSMRLKLREEAKKNDWVVLQVSGYEADDLIHVASKVLTVGQETVMIGSDRDLLQLVDSNNQMILFNQKGLRLVRRETFERDTVHGKIPGYRNPTEFLTGKILQGDRSDNVLGFKKDEGKKGIGEKGAWDLVQKYVTFKNMIKRTPVHPELKIRSEEKLLDTLICDQGEMKPVQFFEFNRKLIDISHVASSSYLQQICIDQYNSQV